MYNTLPPFCIHQNERNSLNNNIIKQYTNSLTNQTGRVLQRSETAAGQWWCATLPRRMEVRALSGNAERIAVLAYIK